MELYKVRINTVVPGEDPKEATEKFYDETESTYNSGVSVTEDDVEVIVPHNDFIKAFRLARLLNKVDQYSATEIQVLVQAYLTTMGYELSDEDVWNGFCKWAERFDDSEDEEIESWLN